MWNIE